MILHKEQVRMKQFVPFFQGQILDKNFHNLLLVSLEFLFIELIL